MFSKQVRIQLIEQDLTAADLAERLHCSPAAVSQYLYGNPTLSTMRKIAEALDCDLNLSLTCKK